jgi:hypothetical protein
MLWLRWGKHSKYRGVGMLRWMEGVLSRGYRGQWIMWFERGIQPLNSSLRYVTHSLFRVWPDENDSCTTSSF